MISLEQVRQLDTRVKKAVAVIRNLTAENKVLKQRITELEAQVEELRREASDRLAEEEQLEAGLQDVINILDTVEEDAVPAESPEPRPEPEEAARKEQAEAAPEEAPENEDSREPEAEEPAAEEPHEEIDLGAKDGTASDDDRSQSEFDIF